MADLTNVIYFDNNATTAIAPEVVEAMMPALGPLYGNASSMHSFGGQMLRHIDKARGQVADLLGADPEEIIYTACGTEADNAAWSYHYHQGGTLCRAGLRPLLRRQGLRSDLARRGRQGSDRP